MRRASRSRCCSGRRSLRTAEACTVMTLTLWPTTSCSSRAILARSSVTAPRARSSRSLSARAARSLCLVRLLELAAEREPDRPEDAKMTLVAMKPSRFRRILGRRARSHRSRVRAPPPPAHAPAASPPGRPPRSPPGRGRRVRRHSGIDERRQDDRSAYRHRSAEREAPAGESGERIARSRGRRTKAGGRGRPTGPVRPDTGETEADGGEEQGIEPVAARKRPEGVHTSKVLQDGRIASAPGATRARS